jgi:hypothetical protein
MIIGEALVWTQGWEARTRGAMPACIATDPPLVTNTTFTIRLVLFASARDGCWKVLAREAESVVFSDIFCVILTVHLTCNMPSNTAATNGHDK